MFGGEDIQRMLFDSCASQRPPIAGGCQLSRGKKRREPFSASGSEVREN